MPEARSNFDPAWDAVYRSKTAAMKYPFEVVVRFVMRHLAQAARTGVAAPPRALEVGCGMGNNLWFAAREGCRVAGIDAVESAIRFARERFAADGLEGDLRVGLFGDLPYAYESFELVIDCGGLTCTGRSVAAQTIREIHRVLVPGGRFLFTPFATEDTSFAASQPGPDGTRVEIAAGTARGVGQLAFYSRAEVEAVFADGWRLTSLELHRREELLADPPWTRALWHAIAEKSS